MDQRLIAALTVLAETWEIEEFKKLVRQFVENTPLDEYDTKYGKELMAFIDDYPSVLSYMEKGEQAVLYRSLVLNDLGPLISLSKSTTLPKRSTLESWSMNSNLGQDWLPTRTDAPWAYSIEFAKKIPESERIVCLPCEELDTQPEEQEVICYSQLLSKREVKAIYVLVPPDMDKEAEVGDIEVTKATKLPSKGTDYLLSNAHTFKNYDDFVNLVVDILTP